MGAWMEQLQRRAEGVVREASVPGCSSAALWVWSEDCRGTVGVGGTLPCRAEQAQGC